MDCYTFTWETINQIVHKYSEKATICTKFLLQSLQMGERSTVMTAEYVRPIHSCPIASLMETSLECYSTTMKQNVRAWSGEHNYHRGSESFACKNAQTYINRVWPTKRLRLNKKPWTGYSVCERAQEMLLKRISSGRPQFWKKSTSFLRHDNVPAHSDDRAALPAEPGHGDRPSTWSREPTFPYSLKCKPPLKDSFRKSSISRKKVTTNLNAVPLSAFDDCFVQLLEGYEQYVAVKGDYYKWKGNAIPLQARTGPEGSSRLRLPDFNSIGTRR